MNEKTGKSLRPGSRRTEVETFLKKVAGMPRIHAGGRQGRLIFALDATASREPTWDRASEFQAQMFQETAALGGLAVQLCYYQGYKRFVATPWVHHPKDLLSQMTAVTCLGGLTQIEKVLRHARDEARTQKINALVFIGDCMEENVDRLCQAAGELAILGVPAFIFQEGYDPLAEQAFRQIAKLTRGAYCRFDAGSPAELRHLLSAVAVYASGGHQALEHFSQERGEIVRQLTHQLKKD